ncbi:MAG: amino acid racemase [Desulfobulbaceae bacterium]|nr:amino acid racemase [Desulfobulbaceae bacterium]
MKIVGMLGGTDWQLTALYCREMNELAQRRLGAGHSAKMLICNPDAAELAALQEKGQWLEVGRLLEESGERLTLAGADFLLICSHSLHIVAEQLAASVSAPFLHIGEAIGERLQKEGISRAGMLGAAFALEQTFLRQRLADNFGIELFLPDTAASFALHDLISQGETEPTPESRVRLAAIFDGFVGQGVEAIILGGRRIGRLALKTDCPLPIYDAVSLHVEAASRLALL